jgi:hypothetical protein
MAVFFGRNKPEFRNRNGSARGPRAGLGGSPKPSFTFFVQFWREKVCGTRFSASRRKPHASGVRSPSGCAPLDFDFGIRDKFAANFSCGNFLEKTAKNLFLLYFEGSEKAPKKGSCGI